MTTVLMVEDDDAVRGALTQVLGRAGWTVVACSGVDEAERRFAEQPCDVVLSDLVMPGRGAFELLASLRNRDPRLAFVVMSGYLTDERFRGVLQQGATDCLAKPCAADELIRALNRAILLRHSIEQPPSESGEHATVVTVPADPAERATVMARIDEAAQVGGFDPRRNRILLALDEAFANAVAHGARGDRSLTIEVRAGFSVNGGVVTVSDPGPGFDPLLVEASNNDGGRHGLALIRAACDDVRWLGRGNVCQMLFRQPPAEEVAKARRGTSTSSRLRSKQVQAAARTLSPRRVAEGE
jgi:CheY-like chemotaxis protein/anti-sigma regulatory factor (Ser/Thr protein kinase)